MEKPKSPTELEKQEKSYLETYEAKDSDLESLQQGIDILAESNLLEQDVLKDIRFVTYDSHYLYVFTRGQHSTKDKFTVEEMPSSSKTDIKVYKIAHNGFVGTKKEDYRGARAWLLCDEIEATAVSARKFPNENVLYEPDVPQPKEILDVVSMAPKEPYEKIQQGRFNYLTDVIFHEAGHIEHRRLENWQGGEAPIETFPSDEQKEEFLSVIRQAKIFPESITALIIENIGKRAISEMYPMLIDREAAKLFDAEKFEAENTDFGKALLDLQENLADQELITRFKESLESGHAMGRLLVRILEEKFLDFHERKDFVRSVLQPKKKDIT